MNEVSIADQIIYDMEVSISNKLFSIKNIDLVANDCSKFPTYKIVVKTPFGDKFVSKHSEISKTIQNMNSASLDYVLTHKIEHDIMQISVHAVPIVLSA